MPLDDPETTLYQNLMRLYRQILLLLEDDDCHEQAFASNNWMHPLTVNRSTNQCGSQRRVISPKDTMRMGFAPNQRKSIEEGFSAASTYTPSNRVSKTDVMIFIKKDFQMRPQRPNECFVWNRPQPQASMQPINFFDAGTRWQQNRLNRTHLQLHSTVYSYIPLWQQQQMNTFNCSHPQLNRKSSLKFYGHRGSVPMSNLPFLYGYPVVGNFGNQQSQFQHLNFNEFRHLPGNFYGHPMYATKVQPKEEPVPGNAYNGLSRFADQQMDFEHGNLYVDRSSHPVCTNAEELKEKAFPGSSVNGLSLFAGQESDFEHENVYVDPSKHEDEQFFVEMCHFAKQQLGFEPEKNPPPENVLNIVSNCVKRLYACLLPEQQSTDICTDKLSPPPNALYSSWPTNRLFAKEKIEVFEQTHDLMHALQQPSNITLPVPAGPVKFNDDVDIEGSTLDIIERCQNIFENLKQMAFCKDSD